MGRLRWSWWLGRARARWRACVVALAVVLAGGGVSGCDGGSGSPSPSVRSPEVSVSGSPTEVSDPSPALMVPVMPGAAKEASEDGARAFVGYYWELVNYAQATGDVRRLRRVSGPNCQGCRVGIEAIQRHYRAGGRIIGGAATPKKQSLIELTTAETGIYAFRIKLTTVHEPQVIVGPDGSREARDSGTDLWDLSVLWVNDRSWRLDVMESR